MAKGAVKYYPVVEIRKTLDIADLYCGTASNFFELNKATNISYALRKLAPFVPKLLYENKGRCVPQASRGHANLVTRPEPIMCAGLLQDAARWLREDVLCALPKEEQAIRQRAERLEIIAAYLPETIDPLHWPLVQQAPNPNGEIRVSNLSGLL